ncbi:hypothetical protein PGT21_027764 [Puccinia graminis f. sp. tritici]|uniref:Uncharacterized protein n=1 Tax=Puccinia graminis f. sp. tritici TaxID=56615 RepID=A0A5B0NH33_PUCGR|nr:hypothetical protein PGT21_027764 [Puccinia graminis f. sp. tritici]
MWKNSMEGNNSRYESWLLGENAEMEPAQEFQKIESGKDQDVDAKQIHNEKSEKHSVFALGEEGEIHYKISKDKIMKRKMEIKEFVKMEAEVLKLDDWASREYREHLKSVFYEKIKSEMFKIDNFTSKNYEEHLRKMKQKEHFEVMSISDLLTETLYWMDKKQSRKFSPELLNSPSKENILESMLEQFLEKQSTYKLDEVIQRFDENIPPKTREYLRIIAEKNGIGNDFSTSRGYYWDNQSVRDLLKIYQITPVYHYCPWAPELNDVIPIEKLYQLLKDGYGFTVPELKKLQENLKEIGWRGEEALKWPMIKYATEWKKS